MCDYLYSRDLLANALKAAGISPLIPEGGFVMMADTSGVIFPDKYLHESTPAAPIMSRDWALCRCDIYLALQTQSTCLWPYQSS